ncbi:DUF6934 family protein [Flavobacterium cerinum]|uniref:Uncharacterized protein n=1 Tax=Flavobacterium cerinum TaxID=2502784 RepID=A0ABY5IP64_9FLAO|nr:hypothetical protein [Flavobacterium cerinum]UUC44625.1 hypothetical protein NOX80_13410 [Flavobacterium cerinum]
MNGLSVYGIQQTAGEIKVQYLFESVGKSTIIKAIEYTPVASMGNKIVYNFGFGDYDGTLDRIIDDVNSNNGDIYRVFNTVLSSVPLFFEANKEAVLIVSGSDSHDEFIIRCLPTCKKKCNAHCKNYQRRIKTYRYYIDKNFEELSMDYIFFGYESKRDEFVRYLPNNHYESILVYKKNG